MKKLVLIILSLSLAFPVMAADFLPPQPWPKKGPWFEGWYLRLTDSTQKRSFATIMTSYTSERGGSIDRQNLKGYQALLVDDVNNLGTALKIEEFPERTSQIGAFWQTTNRSGISTLTENSVDLRFEDGTRLQMEIGERKPWSADAGWWGPAGYLTLLKFFPLQWFVASMGSPTKYKLTIPSKNLVLEGEGALHIEKNWGKMFPEAWIWSQATSEDNSAHLMLAGGPLHFGPLWVNTYLVGYKTGQLDLEFQAGQLLDTEFTSKIDACQGRISLLSRNTEYSLLIQAQAPPDTFSFLSTPGPKGYMEKTAIESFRTKIEVTVRKGGQLIERRVFQNGALEFGGAWMSCDSGAKISP